MEAGPHIPRPNACCKRCSTARQQNTHICPLPTCGPQKGKRRGRRGVPNLFGDPRPLSLEKFPPASRQPSVTPHSRKRALYRICSAVDLVKTVKQPCTASVGTSKGLRRPRSACRQTVQPQTPD